MSYEGQERRITPCKEHDKLLTALDHEINGNGKPGLNARVGRLELALYGDEKNKQKGMIDKQQEILQFVYSVKPFMNQKLLFVLFLLSFLACLKVLGTDLIMDIIKHFLG